MTFSGNGGIERPPKRSASQARPKACEGRRAALAAAARSRRSPSAGWRRRQATSRPKSTWPAPSTASRRIAAEYLQRLGFAQSPSFFEKRWDFWVRNELRPPRLVHIEKPPDAVLLGRIAE